MEEIKKRRYFSSNKARYYDLAMKMYFEDELPITQISKKLSISRMSIYRWIRIFADGKRIESMQKMRKSSPKATEVKKETCQEGSSESSMKSENAQTEIARLKRELYEAQVRAEAYDEMINIAEERFKISIRKKSGAKR
jgi:transposase-like protein